MAGLDADTDAVVHEAVSIERMQTGRAFSDFRRGLAMWKIWVALAWHEFKGTYRRSFFGIFWVIISFSAFLFVKVVIFSALLGGGDHRFYDTYLILGFFIWVNTISSVNAAPDTFISAKGWINSEPLPYSIYIFKIVMREFYNLVLTAIAACSALAFIGYPLKNGYLYSLMAIAFIMINSVSIKLVLGIVAARFRDVTHLVKAVTMPLMFLTPIFWMPEQMGRIMTYLWWNPFFHYLEIFRAPMLTGEFPVESWIFVLTLWAIMTATGFLLFARFRQRIVFWL